MSQAVVQIDPGTQIANDPTIGNIAENRVNRDLLAQIDDRDIFPKSVTCQRLSVVEGIYIEDGTWLSDGIISVGNLDSGVQGRIFVSAGAATGVQGWGYGGGYTEINGGAIHTGTIVVGALDSSATDLMFVSSSAATGVQSWGTSGYTLIDGGYLATETVEAGSIAAGAVTTPKLAAGAVTIGKLSNGFRGWVETWENGLDTDYVWGTWVVGTGSATVTTADSNATMGASVLRTTGYVYGYADVDLIPFDPTVLYRLRIRARYITTPITSAQKLYAGIRVYDEDKNALTLKTDGVTAHNANLYRPVSSLTPTDNDWHEYVAYIQGLTPDLGADGSETNTGTPGDPATCHPYTKYFAPLMLINYNTQDSKQWEIDWFRIDPMGDGDDSAGIRIANGYTTISSEAGGAVPSGHGIVIGSSKLILYKSGVAVITLDGTTGVGTFIGVTIQDGSTWSTKIDTSGITVKNTASPGSAGDEQMIQVANTHGTVGHIFADNTGDGNGSVKIFTSPNADLYLSSTLKLLLDTDTGVDNILLGMNIGSTSYPYAKYGRVARVLLEDYLTSAKTFTNSTSWTPITTNGLAAMDVGEFQYADKIVVHGIARMTTLASPATVWAMSLALYRNYTTSPVLLRRWTSAGGAQGHTLNVSGVITSGSTSDYSDCAVVMEVVTDATSGSSVLGYSGGSGEWYTSFFAEKIDGACVGNIAYNPVQPT